ncbi:unnamed protein product [Moneuplotes crassus]|uniref:Uncharacterized protein n=1 Tax=Euplotes crassus TaxID=5936 RepID=A0AAD1UPL6_EUPCR|nr:unnamed protein product [Moneuplotes crassus]
MEFRYSHYLGELHSVGFDEELCLSYAEKINIQDLNETRLIKSCTSDRNSQTSDFCSLNELSASIWSTDLTNVEEPNTSISTTTSYNDKSKLEEMKNSCTYFRDILDNSQKYSTKKTESQPKTQSLESNRYHNSDEIGPKSIRKEEVPSSHEEFIESIKEWKYSKRSDTMFISMNRKVGLSYYHMLNKANPGFKRNYKFRDKDYSKLKEVYDKEILPFLRDGTPEADNKNHDFEASTITCTLCEDCCC